MPPFGPKIRQLRRPVRFPALLLWATVATAGPQFPSPPAIPLESDAAKADLRLHAQLAAAEKLQHAGALEAAVTQYRSALKAAIAADEPVWGAMFRGALGGALLQLGRLDEARRQLETSLEAAEQQQALAVIAATLNQLGNLHRAAGEPARALEAYQRSAALALRVDDPGTLARARINMIPLSGEETSAHAALTHLNDAFAAVEELSDTERTEALVRIGAAALAVSGQNPRLEGTLVDRAISSLEEAYRRSEALEPTWLASFAAGHLANAYHRAGRVDDSIRLTTRAVSLARRAQAPDPLFRWQWQLARLQRQREDPGAALANYREAVATLETIRPSLSTRPATPAGHFSSQLDDLYLETADLLLALAEAEPDRPRAQRLLYEARDVIESRKATELEEFYQDDCVASARAAATSLDAAVPQSSAVLYPVILPDRLAILLEIGQKMRLATVPVPASTLTAEIALFRHHLEKRATREYLRQASGLHRWLIDPVQAALDRARIETLVIVPDASLSRIPFSALHDGERFLVERFELAVTPGLALTDVRPPPKDRNALLAGALEKSVRGLPPLPHTIDEVRSVTGYFDGTVLNNEAFITERIEEEMGEREYGIVHLASHAFFAEQAARSFLVTYDGRLEMGALERSLGNSRYRDRPVDLLTLSACHTAAGTDRAALGLAGIAVKAGVRSALATLWSVNDAATAQLIGRFYERLAQDGMTKSRALQDAQRMLLESGQYDHPAYWAPFVLIGNWL